MRLETPPPVEPSPDATEQVRARTVDDALDLAAAATALLPAVADEPVRAVLDDVAAFSARHADELGGVYDSGLPDPSPSASPAPAPLTVTDVTQLLDELVDDAARAAGDADDVADGALARLVASVAVSRDGLADRLAAATGRPRPEPTADGSDADAPDASDAPVEESAEDDAAQGDDGSAGVGEGTLALALAHDEAAWTFTVLAARSSEARRTTLLEGAAQHRAASDAWAGVAGVVGGPDDPRRAAYALPAAVDDPAVLEALPRSVEQAVADASASAVAGSAPGRRGDAVASLRAATAAAVTWGAAGVAFPGMPELASAPVG